MNGTTTGGDGGTTVTVTSLSALQSEAKSSGKKVVKVQGLLPAGPT